MQELLSQYILLEDYFMTQNIRKAIQQHQQIDKGHSEVSSVTQQFASTGITPSASSLSLSSAAGSAIGDEGSFM